MPPFPPVATPTTSEILRTISVNISPNSARSYISTFETDIIGVNHLERSSNGLLAAGFVVRMRSRGMVHLAMAKRLWPCSLRWDFVVLTQGTGIVLVSIT